MTQLLQKTSHNANYPHYHLASVQFPFHLLLLYNDRCEGWLFFTNLKSYLYPWFLGFNGKCSLDPDASSSSLHSVSWNANDLNRKSQVSLHG